MKTSINSILLGLMLLLGNCGNIVKQEPVKVNNQKFHEEGRFIVRETYGSNGVLQAKQFFNKDTVPDGAEIDYHPNGTVEKWKWYLPKDRYPKCVVYYDENGRYDTMIGNPFLNGIAEDKGTSIYVFIINPVNIDYFITLDDQYNNKSIAEYEYDPTSLDTVNFISLNKEGGYAQKADHHYFLYFCVVDSARGIIHKIPKAIEATKDYSKPVDIPYKVFPLGKLKKV